MALSDAVTTLKATGNEQFRENDFLRAAASYSKALKLASKEGCERCVRADASHRLRDARRDLLVHLHPFQAVVVVPFARGR